MDTVSLCDARLRFFRLFGQLFFFSTQEVPPARPARARPASYAIFSLGAAGTTAKQQAGQGMM
jgi:hypothetical protein